MESGHCLKKGLFFFAGKNYWAKDLIFLAFSQGGAGVQAWVDQYMGLAAGEPMLEA